MAGDIPTDGNRSRDRLYVRFCVSSWLDLKEAGQLAIFCTFHHVFFDDFAELLHVKFGQVLAFPRSFQPSVHRCALGEPRRPRLRDFNGGRHLGEWERMEEVGSGKTLCMGGDEGQPPNPDT